MKKQVLISATAIFIATVLFSPIANATVWRVNNHPSNRFNQWVTGTHRVFDDLNTACQSNLVNPNDTLLVEGTGTGYASIDIYKPLVLIGTGYFLSGVSVNPNLQYNPNSALIRLITLHQGAAGTKLIGLDVTQTGTGSYGIDINDSNITVSRCYISRIVFTNWNGGGNYVLNNILIKQNYIYGGISFVANALGIHNYSVLNNYVHGQLPNAAIYTGTTTDGLIQNNVIYGSIDNNSSTVIIKDNIFQQSGAVVNPQSLPNSTTNINYNIFSPSIPAYYQGANNISITNIAAAFPTVGSYDSILHPILANCWDCYNSSSTSGELGVFGGNSPYILSGIPDVPTIYNLTNADNSILQNGQDTIGLSTRTIANASTITRCQYFWDTDSGFALTASYNFPFSVVDTNNYLLYAYVRPLGIGTYHTFFIRTCDNNGRWSETNYLDSVLVNGNVGIADLKQLINISISPNPVSDYLTVTPNDHSKIRMVIYNAEGKLMDDKIISEQTLINVRSYSAGIYTTYFWKEGKSIYALKLIKQ